MNRLFDLLIHNMKLPADPFINWIASTLLAFLAFAVAYNMVTHNASKPATFLQYCIILPLSFIFDITFWFLSIVVLTIEEAVHNNINYIIPLVLIASAIATSFAIYHIVSGVKREHEEEMAKFGPKPKTIAEKMVRRQEIEEHEKKTSQKKKKR